MNSVLPFDFHSVWEQPGEVPVRTAGATMDIRTRHTLNISLYLQRYCNLLGFCLYYLKLSAYI